LPFLGQFDRVARGDRVELLELEVDLSLLFAVFGVGELLLERLLVVGELLLQLGELAAERAGRLVAGRGAQATTYQDETGDKGALHRRTEVQRWRVWRDSSEAGGGQRTAGHRHV